LKIYQAFFIEMPPYFQVNLSMKWSKKCFVRNGIQFHIGRKILGFTIKSTM